MESGHDAEQQQTVPIADPPAEPDQAQTANDELEPQLKYERLGADVKTILQDASATCLCLSEKVLALGTSTGKIHILDYSGNEVKRFDLHSKPVRHISFDDKAEYVASCCGENYVSVSGLYSDETNKFTFKRPITVVAVEPRYASRKTREFVTGDVRGRLKLSSQGWLGRSDTLIHQGEGTIRAVTWHSSTLVWANDVGVKVYDSNLHQFVGSIARPKGGRFSDCYDCRLYLHEGTTLYVTWPDCVKVAHITSSSDPVSGAVVKRLATTHQVPTDAFCMGAVPHGADLAVLMYVTDQDPDQDQQDITITDDPRDQDHATSDQQQQQQQQEEDTAEKQQAETITAAGSEGQSGDKPADTAAAGSSTDNTTVAAAGGADPSSAASFSGPINIPQPVRRAPRAANAIVRSPSGPSVLEEAAAAAVASAASATATAAAAAAGSSSTEKQDTTAEAGGDGTTTTTTTAAGGAGDSSSKGASPEKSPSRKLSFKTSSSSTAAAAAAAASVSSPTAAKPPLPGSSWSRVSSMASSRTSDTAAAEVIQAPYTPPGQPLRPELRILTLDSSTKVQQQQQQQVASSCTCYFEKASDALTVKGYQDYLPSEYLLVPSYGNDLALMSSGGIRQQRRQQQHQQQQRRQQRHQQQQRRQQRQQGVQKDHSSAAAAGDSGIATAMTQQEQGDDKSTTAVAAGSSEQTPGAAAATTAAAAAGSSGDVVVEDFGEFMYFIVSPKDIVVGRHRDSEDRISWLLSAGRFEAALAIAEADRSLNRSIWDTVVQVYLEYLTAGGQWSTAAVKLQHLLGDQANLWERWVYVFAQARQLAVLAPVLPTKQPLLHMQCYDLVLQALLVDPVHHGQLLHLVQTWPTSCFHPTALIDAIATRMQRPGVVSGELWQCLAVLYKSQGRPDLSLAIYLQLQLPSVFDFIEEHNLLGYLDDKAYLLMAVDESRALDLLAGHLDTLATSCVVPGLLDAMSVCESEGDAAGQQIWRRRLFRYLDKVFQVDSSCVGDYSELCVHLYADYCPERLMEFLQGSQTFPLEAALEVVEQRGMVHEQVYILSRMGNTRAALALIIEQLQDIPRAIEFVRAQRDDELVEELIDWALRSADTTGQLLDHIGGNLNPLRVIQKIPEGMEISRLRDRLRSIIADFRTQTSLREGCNAILRSDCIHLVQRLQLEVKRALPTVWVQRMGSHGAGMPPSLAAAAAAAAAEDEGPGYISRAAAAEISSTGLITDRDGDDDHDVDQPGTPTQQISGVTKAFVEGAGFITPLDQTPPGTPGGRVTGYNNSSNSSSTTVAQRVLRGSRYLPAAAVPGGKGAQWLKYCGGSGRMMEVVAGHDVPAAAVAEAAISSSSGNGASSRSAPAWVGGSIPAGSASSDLLPSQPVRTWIGLTAPTGDDSTLLQLMTRDTAAAAAAGGLGSPEKAHYDQTGISSSSSSSSRRTSKAGGYHGHGSRQRAGTALASLVAA